MGVTGSTIEQIAAPWQPADLSKRYPPSVEETIRGLSKSVDTFLQPVPEYVAPSIEFVQDNFSRCEMALQTDSLLFKWLPRLVPKTISESNFFINYWSHVFSVTSRISTDALLDRLDTVDSDTGTSVVEHSSPSVSSPCPSLKFGLIGLHSPASQAFDLIQTLSLIPNAELTALCVNESEISQGKQYVGTCNAVLYADVDVMLLNSSVDVVVINTLPGLHRELAVKVAEADKPCILLPPLGRSASEAIEICDVFSSAGLSLFVAYHFRFLHKFSVARDHIKSDLGKITSISYVLSRPDHLLKTADTLGDLVLPVMSGGGLLHTLGCHSVDMLSFLFDPISDVYGDAARQDTGLNMKNVTVENVCTLGFRSNTHSLGTARWDFACAIDEDLLVVNGTKATMTLSLYGTDYPVIHSVNEHNAEILTKEYPADKQNIPSNLFLPVFESISRYLHECSQQIHHETSAVTTAKLIDTAYRRFYRDRSDDYWTRSDTWQT